MEGRKEMFYFTVIWHRTYGKETRCHHMGYSFRLTARVLLYAPSHRQDSTYHGLCYTSRGALAETRNSSMGPPHEGSIRWPIAPWANTLTTEVHLAPYCVLVAVTYCMGCFFYLFLAVCTFLFQLASIPFCWDDEMTSVASGFFIPEASSKHTPCNIQN